MILSFEINVTSHFVISLYGVQS